MLNINYRNKDIVEKGVILIGDIGGTKTNLALCEIEEGELQLSSTAKYSSKSYEGIEEIILDFISGDERIDAICLGVAGPVINGKAKITNLDWEIDTQKIREATNLSQVFILNDLEANAYGISALRKEDILTIHKGDTSAQGNIALISPGTGLGEAGMYWDGQYHYPFATEGGHADYAPETELDVELFSWLKKKFGHVSWERVVSGQGIESIYSFLVEKNKLTVMGKEMKSGVDISQGARAGDEACKACMNLFLRNLANETANLTLKVMATGGVYIGGGIVPKNLDLLQKQQFVNYFIEAGRMRTLLQNIPIHIILNEQTALLGAGKYGYYS